MQHSRSLRLGFLLLGFALSLIACTLTAPPKLSFHRYRSFMIRGLDICPS